MKANEKIINAIMRNIQEQDPHAILSALWEKGLLCQRAAEQLYMQGEIERRVGEGERKYRAIELVAIEMNCSFEKVRAAIYKKRKPL